MKQPADILFLIEARLDTGRDKGAPQLGKDRRVLARAADEIRALRADAERYRWLRSLRKSRPGATGLGVMFHVPAGDGWSYRTPTPDELDAAVDTARTASESAA